MTKTTHQPKAERYPLLDFIRGVAVICMILFHLIFDLGDFRAVAWAQEIMYSVPFQAFGRLVLFLFLFSVGLSLAIVHAGGIQWRSFWRREIKLIGAATLVSVATYLAFPERWIYFGILHCIAFASLIALPLLQRPLLAMAIALPLLISHYGFHYNLPWITMGHASWDYVSPFPWFAFVMLGIVAYHLGLHRLGQGYHWFPTVKWLGNHSLPIYLIHQPLFAGLIMAYLYLHP